MELVLGRRLVVCSSCSYGLNLRSPQLGAQGIPVYTHQTQKKNTTLLRISHLHYHSEEGEEGWAQGSLRQFEREPHYIL